MPWNYKDNNFEVLLNLQSELIALIKENAERGSIRAKKKSVQLQLKRMSGQIIQVRLNNKQIKPLQGSDQKYFNLYKIDNNAYSFDKGIDLIGTEFLI